jgi:hypothetical protein
MPDATGGYPRVMRIRTRIAIVGLTTYGGYTLWRRYGSRFGLGGGGSSALDPRISARAGLTASEAAVGSDDPVAQATAILADSDDRSLLSRDAPGVERRHSEDTVEH